MADSVQTDSTDANDTNNITHSRLNVSQILDSMSQSELDDIVAVAQKMESTPPKQSSNAKENFNDEDDKKIIDENIEVQIIDNESNNKAKEKDKIHQQLKQHIESSMEQSAQNIKMNDSNHDTPPSKDESKEPLINPQHQNDESAEFEENMRTKVNYSDLSFIEYESNHLAQFLFDETQRAFEEDGSKDCDLYRIIFEDNIDGNTLSENLTDGYFKKAINSKIKDGKHKLKKATIKHIIDNASSVDKLWRCEQVFECLYFAECALIQNAIINLSINGKEFIEMDSKEWSKRLKTNYKIPLSVSQGYYTKIV